MREIIVRNKNANRRGIGAYLLLTMECIAKRSESTIVVSHKIRDKSTTEED